MSAEGPDGDLSAFQGTRSKTRLMRLMGRFCLGRMGSRCTCMLYLLHWAPCKEVHTSDCKWAFAVCLIVFTSLVTTSAGSMTPGLSAVLLYIVPNKLFNWLTWQREIFHLVFLLYATTCLGSHKCCFPSPIFALLRIGAMAVVVLHLRWWDTVYLRDFNRLALICGRYDMLVQMIGPFEAALCVCMTRVPTVNNVPAIFPNTM